MTEAEWLTGTDCTAHVEYLADRLTSRRSRLLAVGFCRAVAGLIEHPELLPALLLLEEYADGLISEAEAEKARRHWRALATQGFERYRASLDFENPTSTPAPRNAARSDVAWALAFAFNYNPVPVADIYARVSGAALAAELGMPPDAESRRTEVRVERALAIRAIVWDVVGNPFRPVAFSPAWRTDTAIALARQMYEAREFSAMPILADALQDAGCDSEEVLTHCRDTALAHVRGCWVVDGVLGKE